MMKIYKYLIGLTLITSIKSVAQNASIVYTGNSSLCTSCCNVFNMSGNNPTVGNIPHWPVSGGATFDGTSVNMATRNDPSANPVIDNGTAYAIAYNFKTGFTYSITIDLGYSSTPTGVAPRIVGSLRTSLPSPGDTHPTDCGPVSQSRYASSIGSQTGFIIPTQTAVKNYPISNPNFSVTAAQSYFVVTVYNGASGGSTVKITKISITEAVVGSFSLIPVNVAFSCGSTTPVTFTVNNGANTPGVTGHTWNLGSASNGWLYNSSAAPQTISTGTTNTLTLTPECGSVQSTISAIVTANGINYPTNSSAVSITQPTMSISGSAAFCVGTSNYSVVGLPCNSTVAWSISPPSGIASIFPITGPSTTITKVADGNVTLMANVTSCGAATSLTLPVHIGAYTSSDYTLSGNNGSTYYCTNQTISFGVSGAASTNHVWTVPSGWTTVYNGGSYVALRAPSSSYPPTGTVSVSFTEPCGATVTKSMFLAYSSSACNTNDPRFKIYPNPASSYLNVEVDLALPNNSNTHIVGVQLLNQSATLVYNQSYPNNPGNFYQGVQIPVYNQVNGNYTLRVYDGTTWVTYAVVVQH